MSGSPKELSIRVNPVGSPFFQDDAALIRDLKPQTVVLSKVESPEDVRALEAALALADAPDQPLVEFIALIETIAGFYRVREILASSRRITGVMLGAEDLAGEMGIERGPLAENPLLNHMQIEIAIACHLHGIQCLGPVNRGYEREAHLRALEEECRYLKRMNVRGRFAIHPSQIAIINRVFDITPEQIRRARRVLALFGAAQEGEGTSVITQGDQMEDLPSQRSAADLLAYAEAHGFVQEQSAPNPPLTLRARLATIAAWKSMLRPPRRWIERIGRKLNRR
jgi:citrate lyase subunit beta/citryl-CoA lyase